MTGEIKLRFTLGDEEPIELVVDVDDDTPTAIRLEGSPKLGARTKLELGDSTGIWIGGTYVGEVRLPIVLEVAP